MKPRRAFTLIETLITILLSAFLLLTLWTLFGTYLRMFQVGQARSSRAQLMRGLLAQLADDLHGALQDTAAAPPGALGASRRFGFFGSSTTLQFDMLLPVAAVDPEAAANTGTAGNVDPASIEPTLAAEAMEMRTVRYTFQAPPDATTSDSDDTAPATPPPSDQPVQQAGLVREEFDFQPLPDTSGNASSPSAGGNGQSNVYGPSNPYASSRASRASGGAGGSSGPSSGQLEMPNSLTNPPDASSASTSGSGSSQSSATGQNAGTGSSSGSATGSDDSDDTVPDQLATLGAVGASSLKNAVTYLPEVAALQFRYFDGSNWNNTWNSLARKSLPTAVEITVQLQPADEPPPPPPVVPPDQDPDLMQMADSTPPAPPAVYCRMVVDLPLAAMHPDSGVADSGDAPGAADQTAAAAAPPDDPSADAMSPDALAGADADQDSGQPIQLAPSDQATPEELASLPPLDDQLPADSMLRRRPPPAASSPPPVIENIAPDAWMRGGPR